MFWDESTTKPYSSQPAELSVNRGVIKNIKQKEQA
jgi:hypothetical protein